MIMKEIWKDIPGYEGKYQASNMGRVKNVVSGRVLKPNGRYLLVVLVKGKEHKNILVSRAVWSAFNGPIPPGMQVNHINEDKHDNRLENLNLMTPKENANWGTRNKRVSDKQRNDKAKSKVVLAFSLNTGEVKTYESAHEASRQTGYSRGTICNACRGLYGGVLRGYKWKYA